jgi:hypothetical protein
VSDLELSDFPMPDDLDHDAGVAQLLAAIAEALHGKGKMPDMEPDEMLKRLDVEVPYDAVASAWETSGCFEVEEAAEYLYGRVSDERMEELQHGATPTDEELTLARDEFRQGLSGRECGFSVYLYTLKDSRGRPVCFISVHGDGGYLVGACGPYASEEKAKASRYSDDDEDCMTHADWW